MKNRGKNAADRPVSATAVERARVVLEVVARIPVGRVTTYGTVAARAGLPRQARLVGKVLSGLPDGSAVPWQRVVAAGGRIAFPEGSEARTRQIEKLRAEGVDAGRGRVDLRRYGWGSPESADDLDRWLWSGPGVADASTAKKKTRGTRARR